ncbi:hypothetical protein M1397_03425 [Candidatus Marsarchaeota archaeon]|nr:hypothetical protein [Candidatus Marsarchaeota archaeon]
MMEEVDRLKRNVGFTYIALCIGAIILLFGSVYLINLLSTVYGIGVGATVQSLSDNTPIASQLVPFTAQSATLGRGVLESYISFFIAIAIGAGAFILLLNRREVPTKTASKYTTLTAVLSIIFILLYYLASEGIPSAFVGAYAYLPYLGFLICVLSVAYVEYVIRMKQPKRTPSRRGAVALNPSTPFSNMLNLQNELMNNLSGAIRIVDKHFNSTAIVNLYRLLSGFESNFNKITILTSKEMLGASFPEEVRDLRRELGASGIELDVRLMDEKDAVEQHERFIMDQRNAYKMPPFNIINKRSEHVIKASFRDADRRFSELLNRAIKLENYQVEKDRK